METRKDERANIKVPPDVLHKAKEAALKNRLYLWQWIEQKADQDLTKKAKEKKK